MPHGLSVCACCAVAANDPAALTKLTMEDGAGGGELTFIPRANATDEDDGYLCLFVHNDLRNQSEFRFVRSRGLRVSS
jgi:carotenoid cleavage dioxygenase-like enzyme